jgi:hypothetical protein
VRAVGGSSLLVLLLQRVDALAVSPGVIHEVHGV